MRFAFRASVLLGLALIPAVPSAEEAQRAVRSQGESSRRSLHAAAPPAKETEAPSGAAEPSTVRRERVAELPSHEILGSTASPDGTSWCILDVGLEERVPRASLRALWESLRKEQPTEWGRFTCRFHVADTGPWADVNEIAIFESLSPPPAAELHEEEELEIVERGEDYCIVCYMGWEIVVHVRPGELDARFTDPVTGQPKRVRLADAPLPPKCVPLR